MRVIVGFEAPPESFRVMWLSESRSGIYVGQFMGAVDIHASYHRDGTRHTRIGKSHHQRWKDVPLSSFSGVKQLQHGSIPIQGISHRCPRVPSVRDELITLDSSQFIGYDTLAVDFWLSDADSGSKLNHVAEHAHLDTGFHHISYSSWTLSSFPNLAFAVSFWAANTITSVGP
jgi:hypothetical protein